MTRLDNESVETGGLDRIRASRDSCSGCTPPSLAGLAGLAGPNGSGYVNRPPPSLPHAPSLAGTTKICSKTPYFSGNFWQETLDRLQPSGSCLIDQPSMPTGRRASSDDGSPCGDPPWAGTQCRRCCCHREVSTETLLGLPAWQSLAEKDRIFPRLQTSSDLLTGAPPLWGPGTGAQYGVLTCRS